MSPTRIEVVRAGVCDLVMDAGRPGWRHLGVPAGGAADPEALAAANQLVGNPEAAAALEITARGPELDFPEGGVVALCGGIFEFRRSGAQSAAMHETLVLAPGERLHVGACRVGWRAWLAVRGGLAVVPVMDSASTFLPGGWGGHCGRALRPGDVLFTRDTRVGVTLRRACPPDGYLHTATLHLIAGAQHALLDDAGVRALYTGRFRVSPQSDRRGIRLEGPPVGVQASSLPSQGVMPGAVQVPPDGQPILVGWDGPVTGGYPVVGTLIEADWARMAQLRPGDEVRFSAAGREVARSEHRTWRVSEWG